MATGLIYDDRFLEHDTGPGHPERPQRLDAIVKQLKDDGIWEKLVHLPFTAANIKTIERVHDRNYIRRVEAACVTGKHYIDAADSAISHESYQAAVLAAGGVVAAVDAVMAGAVANAFCAVRPPGHHAERNFSMGFCLFNNVAIAAEHAIAKHGLTRVAIVDFDVHHGNGTQHAFEDRPDVLFISVHEHPRHQYPGTGFEHEMGLTAGHGHTLNIPLLPGGDDDTYRRAFESKVLPALDAFKPQLLLVSAGFDAAATDPLGHMAVTTDGFAWMSRQLKAIAQKHCRGRLVSTLEGGYDLPALAQGVAAHVRVLLAES